MTEGEKLSFELLSQSHKWKDILREIINSRITNKRIESQIREVVREKLEMTPEALENIIQKAFEKATKDIAKWKLIRDLIDLDIKVKRMEKTLIKRLGHIEGL